MKLVLANNQTEQFVLFHEMIQTEERIYHYASYNDLLFYFASGVSTFCNTKNNKHAENYDGVYLNGYLSNPEIAFTAANVLDHNKIAYVNSELHNAPSLTKLSSYAKLAHNNISIPKTYGGSVKTLKHAIKNDYIDAFSAPYILKRADADRGIDNYILDSLNNVVKKLQTFEDGSLWLLQEFIPNEGYYVATYYHDKLAYCIYRALGVRKDRDPEKAHMFKPKGGINAEFLKLDDTPESVNRISKKSCKALSREIASVDVVHDTRDGEPYVLEVNYNPQLVTISTFQMERKKPFLDGIKAIE